MYDDSSVLKGNELVRMLCKLGWDHEEAGEQTDSEQDPMFLVWIDEEADSDEFFNQLRSVKMGESLWHVAQSLLKIRTNEVVTCSPPEVLALSELQGFNTTQVHAPFVLLSQSIWG